MEPTQLKKPKWLTTRIGGGCQFKDVKRILKEHHLNTVCDSARCPNRGECFESGTATFMILGNECTRGCRFCAVPRSAAPETLDKREPQRIADAAQSLKLSYVVVTSVTRDDLPDGGADHFARTISAVKQLKNAPRIELLIPDLKDAPLKTVVTAGPDVLAHNIEVPRPLSKAMRHHRFDYDRSLSVLEKTKRITPSIITKSSIMLGLGETDESIRESMLDLIDVGVDILVMGQYLRPTLDNTPVVEYVPPKRFERYARMGMEMGFGFVAAKPLARTSYRAKEAYDTLVAKRVTRCSNE